MRDIFDQYQQAILKFLNSPYRKYFDIPYIGDSKIIKAFPNGVVISDGKNAKWYFWGRDVIADSLSSANFYFPNFEYQKRFRYAWLNNTFNTAVGDGECTATDTTWATLRAATTANQAVDYTSTTLRIDSEKSGANFFISRGFLPFDTSALSGKVPSSATLQIVETAVSAGSAADIYIVTTSQAATSSLTANDFDNITTTAQSASPLATSGGAGTYSQALNATGLSNVNTSGFSLFGLRHTDDFNNNTPTGLSEMQIGAVENGTSENRPLLTVVTPDIVATGGFSFN